MMGDASGLEPGASRYGATTPNIIATSDQREQFQTSQASYTPVEHFRGNGPPGPSFYAQFDSLPAQYSRPMAPNFSQYNQFQTSAHRLNMSSVANALPDGAHSFPNPSYSNPGSFKGQTLNSPSPHGMRHQMAPQQQFHPPTFRQHSSGSGSDSSGAPYRADSGPPMQTQQPPYAQHPYFGNYGPPYFAHQDANRMGVMAESFTQAFAPMMSLPPGQMSQHAGIDPRAYFAGQMGTQHEFMAHPIGPQFSRRLSEAGPTPSYPRGPPRKPKQSGHALWVGNLPPGTNVMDLKDHFSRDATKEIESLFLISKSNCAFVNYRTETACAAAMTRFHDSRFHGVRLVCRLRRRSGIVGVSQPDGVSLQETQKVDSPVKDNLINGGTENDDGVDGAAVEHHQTGKGNTADNSLVPCGPPSGRTPEKYFIVKSLTMQDLDASVRNGIWATQSHNEQVLNKAFENADAVYLIFSANKSGEYFGYARMKTAIQSENGSVAITNAPAAIELLEVNDGPKSTPTPATEWAPNGRVIDDSARGTIFWEADPLDVNDVNGASSHARSEAAEAAADDVHSGNQDWGKPFTIEWMSTNRLPFYRTRGLRNPWNANREVKIARDGTELEPSVGKRLVQMFHRPGPPAVPVQMGMRGPPIGQMGMDHPGMYEPRYA